MKTHSQKTRFRKLQLALLILTAGFGLARAQESFSLSDTDPNMVESENNGRARANRSTQNHPMSIAGESFANGMGMRAPSQLILDLQGKAESFTAKVGVDDEVTKGTGSVIFKLVSGKRTLWQSPVMHSGDAALEVNVKLKGVKQLTLIADDAGNGSEGDDADWVDAKIISQVKPIAQLAPREKAVILHPNRASTARKFLACVPDIRSFLPSLRLAFVR
jgi:alpha-galactosidase